MFKTIRHINDVRPFVAHKREIRFQQQPNGVTVACYQYMDSRTFDGPEALECRGIAFDSEGRVVSRPLHKFFNLGEKEGLMPAVLEQREDLVAVLEKLDGFMLATAWVGGELKWRSKKSFESDVALLAQKLVQTPAFEHLNRFAHLVASQGMTAIFELQHPLARIVVAVDEPRMRLLHVRDNTSGEYVLLNPLHPIHKMVAEHGVELVGRRKVTSFSAARDSLVGMQNEEGHVLQYANGDLVKMKCAWYQRLHRSITFLRERDIALSALNLELDDLKSVLTEVNVDLTQVEEVETRVKSRMLEIGETVESLAAAGAHLDRKAFALKHDKHPLFGLLMAQYQGRDLNLADWFVKNCLKKEFSLRVLVDGALAEALAG